MPDKGRDAQTQPGPPSNHHHPLDVPG